MVIGLADAGFMHGAAGSPPLGLGIGGKLTTWPILVFVVGPLLTVILFTRRVRGAILIGILSTTVLAIIVESIAQVGSATVNPHGWRLSVPKLPATDAIADTPDLSLLGHFSLLGSWQRAGWLVALMFTFTLLLTDFFDTMGTMVAVG